MGRKWGEGFGPLGFRVRVILILAIYSNDVLRLVRYCRGRPYFRMTGGTNLSASRCLYTPFAACRVAVYFFFGSIVPSPILKKTRGKRGD